MKQFAPRPVRFYLALFVMFNLLLLFLIYITGLRQIDVLKQAESAEAYNRAEVELTETINSIIRSNTDYISRFGNSDDVRQILFNRAFYIYWHEGKVENADLPTYISNIEIYDTQGNHLQKKNIGTHLPVSINPHERMRIHVLDDGALYLLLFDEIHLDEVQGEVGGYIGMAIDLFKVLKQGHSYLYLDADSLVARQFEETTIESGKEIVEYISFVIRDLGIGESFEQLLKTATLLTLLPLILLLIITAFALHFLFAQPLGRLTESLQKNYEEEDMPDSMLLEVQQLSDALGSYRSDLELANLELQIKNDRLDKALEDAQVASEAKSQFLSHMSHELRTPLNAVLGFAQLLELESDDPTIREYTDHILGGGQHLLHLINEILDLSKIEAGKIWIASEKVVLSRVVEESLAMVRNMAESRSIIIDNLAGDHLLQANHTRLKQVLINLLSNAVKYNREHGRVTISTAVEHEGLVRISVTDEGDGLTEQQLAVIFKPFERAGADITSSADGVGIGLTISKHLVELMYGRIGVESTPGKGTCFWLDIPLHGAGTTTEEPEDTAEDLMLSMTPELSQKMSSNTRKILYVEDNPENMSLVRRIIEDHTSFELIEAIRATDGINLATQEQPDLILMDIQLPGMSGNQALGILKSLPETQGIPVIALTANAMPSDVEAGLEAGFIAYMTKPIRVTELLEHLVELVQED